MVEAPAIFPSYPAAYASSARPSSREGLVAPQQRNRLEDTG